MSFADNDDSIEAMDDEIKQLKSENERLRTALTEARQQMSDNEAERLIREVLESRKLEGTLWEEAALKFLGDDKVYCACAEPIWKVWKDGSTYCTRCGNYKRSSLPQPDDVTPE